MTFHQTPDFSLINLYPRYLQVSVQPEKIYNAMRALIDTHFLFAVCHQCLKCTLHPVQFSNCNKQQQQQEIFLKHSTYSLASTACSTTHTSLLVITPLPVGQQSTVMSTSVCVCLSASISLKLHTQT